MINLSKSVIDFVEHLPYSVEYQVIKKQIIRSVTSVGANNHAACRARSYRDYLHKLLIVQEECAESIYWMELIVVLKTELKNDNFNHITTELNEILSIIIASILTLKKRINQ